MKTVFKRTPTLKNCPSHYCPGCGHGIAHRLLAETIDELTEALEAKNAEVAELEAKLSESDEKLATAASELEAAKTETETAKTDLEKVETEISEMKKDKAMELRVAELEKAGVLRSDKEGQAKKVRDMSDEEFAAYKEELVSVRETIVAELAQAAKKAEEEKAAAEDAEDNKEDASDDDAGDDDNKEDASEDDDAVDTAPANIDPGQAVSAALNMEVFPSADLKDKYGKLGQAMAEMFKKQD